MKKIIAVLAGGDSSEIEVSYRSAANVYSSLDREKYLPYIVSIEGSKWEAVTDEGNRYCIDKNDFSFCRDGHKTLFDYALIMIHGTPGENGILQSYFELIGLPYSGCDVHCSSITFDKITCKRVLADTGIRMAGDCTLHAGDTVDVSGITGTLGLPLFIKPSRSGSSFGVSKVKTTEELLPAVHHALKESDEVIAEEFIDGTEVACGIFMCGGELFVFPLTEIVSENEFFDYRAKYEGLSQEITPARIPESVAEKVREDARKIYHRLDCRGLVRVDFIIRDGEPYFIEVNTVPGMSAESIVPKQAKVAGTTLGKVFDKIIGETIK